MSILYHRLCRFHALEAAETQVVSAPNVPLEAPVILPFRPSSFPRPQRPQSCPLQRRLIAPRFGK